MVRVPTELRKLRWFRFHSSNLESPIAQLLNHVTNAIMFRLIGNEFNQQFCWFKIKSMRSLKGFKKLEAKQNRFVFQKMCHHFDTDLNNDPISSNYGRPSKLNMVFRLYLHVVHPH